MKKKQSFLKGSNPEALQKATTVYSPSAVTSGSTAVGFNISQQVGDLSTYPIMGTPGVTNSIGGRDFLSVDVTTDFIPYINQASYMRSHFEVYPMDGPSVYKPKFAGAAQAYATGEGQVMAHTQFPTTTVALVAKAMAVSFSIPREIADDAIINLMPAIRDHLVDRFVLAEEEAFLLGDPSFFAGTGSVRSLFSGISKLAEYDSAGGEDVMSNNAAPLVNAEGNPLSIEHVNEAIENLDLLAQNPDDLLGVMNRHHARTLRGDGVVLKVLTNFGPSPVFRTGRIGEVFGIKFVQTSLLNPKYPIATNDGKYWAWVGFGGETPAEITSPDSDSLSDYGTGNRIYAQYNTSAAASAAQTAYSEILIAHKDSCVIGDRQAIELESSAHTMLAARSLLMVAHERLAFTGQLRKGLVKIVQLS
jgi:hypothetical protein